MRTFVVWPISIIIAHIMTILLLLLMIISRAILTVAAESSNRSRKGNSKHVVPLVLQVV